MGASCASFVSISLALLLAGCATITTGGFQTISVNTEPEGADCQFSREGKVVARVDPTPGSIVIGKSNNAISVLCRKNGYQDAVVQATSAFEPMTLGNVLIGGLIGLVVDGASGAMTKYPQVVTLLLTPQEFETSAHRDAFFADLTTSFLAEHEKVLGRIRASCAPEACERQLQVAEAGRNARLAELEQRRNIATVKKTP
jgi:hypothetical protein